MYRPVDIDTESGRTESATFCGCKPSHLRTYVISILLLVSEFLIFQTILLLDKVFAPGLLVGEFYWLTTLLPGILLSFLAAIGFLFSCLAAKLNSGLGRPKRKQDKTCPDSLLKVFGTLFFVGLAVFMTFIGLQWDEVIHLSSVAFVAIAWGILTSMLLALCMHILWKCFCEEE